MNRDVRVTALLDFNSKIKPQQLFPVTQEGAAAIVEENPFAFALAAVLDRGTKSEIIWTMPYHLEKKIGKLTPEFFVDKSLKELETFFRSLPSKPRYITDAPRTVKELSQMVLREFDGNTAKIWRNRTSVCVQSTFRSIYGVGPGIASMIVLLLEKCFQIHFTDLDHRNMDVKPDVHVIRVFRRMGFIDNQDSESALRAAREFNPDYPGALDAPAWIIGKNWCNPFEPQCAACVVRGVCPKNK